METSNLNTYRVTPERLKEKLEKLKEIIKIYNSNMSDIEKVQQFYKFYTNVELFKKEYNLINKEGKEDPRFKDYIKYFDDIYNTFLEYKKNGLFKEASYQKSILKYIETYSVAEKTVLEYLEYLEQDSRANHKKILIEIGVSASDFKKHLTTIKVLNPKLYEKYNQKEIENQKYRYYLKKADCINLATLIKRGYLEDGTPFDILNFWKLAPFKEGTGTKVEFNEYNKIDKNIVWGSNFVRRIDNFTKYTLPDVNKIILDYINRNKIYKATYFNNNMINNLVNYGTEHKKFITDENNEIIITDKITITGEEYSDIFNYIIEEELPLTKEVLNIIIIKYLNKKIEFKKSNKEKTKILCLKKIEKMTEC